MKSTLSRTLVACLVTSALPVTAQERMETPGSFDLRGPATLATASPFASAVTREAVRLAAAVEPTGGESVQQSGTPVESNWSRVRTLAPATEVVVAVRGSMPGGRYVVRAGETQLTVLNLNDLTLQVDARRVLLEMASRRPEYLTDPDETGVFVKKDVRVGPDGVFVADRKVADLRQVVETIARDEVVEIRRLVRTGGSVPRAALWAAGGYFAGGMAGGLIGGAVDAGFGGEGLGGAFVGILVGAPVGIVWGGIHGYRAGSHRAEQVVYRAP